MFSSVTVLNVGLGQSRNRFRPSACDEATSIESKVTCYVCDNVSPLDSSKQGLQLARLQNKYAKDFQLDFSASKLRLALAHGMCRYMGQGIYLESLHKTLKRQIRGSSSPTREMQTILLGRQILAPVSAGARCWISPREIELHNLY